MSKLSVSVVHLLVFLTPMLPAQQASTRDSLEEALQAACALYRDWKYTAAAEVLEPAVRAGERSLPGRRLAVALTTLGAIYHAQRRYYEAERLFLRAVRIWGKEDAPDAHWQPTLINELACVYHGTGRFTLSEKLLKRYLPGWKERGADSPEVARLMHMLGIAYEGQRRYAEAESSYQESLRILKKRTDQDDYMANLLITLGEFQLRMRHYTEAHESLEGALAIHSRLYGEAHYTAIRPLASLGTLHAATGDLAEAERWLKQALATALTSIGPEHPLTGDVLLRQAAVLRALKRKGEAQQAEKQAKAILQTFRPDNTLRYTVDLSELSSKRNRR